MFLWYKKTFNTITIVYVSKFDFKKLKFICSFFLSNSLNIKKNFYFNNYLITVFLSNFIR